MRRSGFTLIEVVVAMTVAGAAVAAGYSAYQTVLDQQARLEQALNGVTTAAAERRALKELLLGVTLSQEQAAPAFAGLDATLDNKADDQLSFLTRARTPLDVPETTVQLMIDRDLATPMTGLVARFETWRGVGAQTVEIDPRVTGLSLRFYSVPLGHRGWLPSWVSSTLLPAAVEVTLEGRDLPDLLRLPLLVPLGGGT